MGEVLILVLEGDYFPSPDTLGDRLQKLLGEGKKQIIFDLEGLRRVDSMGLGVLIRLKEKAKAGGGDCKLLNPSKLFSELLRLSKLTEYFDIFVDERKAIEAFGKAGQAK